MIIDREVHFSGSDIEPKTRIEKRWYREHNFELKWARENEKCPSCNADLEGDCVLYDRGYKCGLECEFCK